MQIKLTVFALKFRGPMLLNQTFSVSEFLSQELTLNFPMNHHYIAFLKTDLFASIMAVAEWLEFQMMFDKASLHI